MLSRPNTSDCMAEVDSYVPSNYENSAFKRLKVYVYYIT